MLAHAQSAELVVHVQNGNIDALGVLYQRHKRLVFRTALAITHDKGMAEDILQETFVRVYKYADSFDQTQPFEPWLYRITVNLTYSWINRAKRILNLFQNTFEWIASPSRQIPEVVAESKEQNEILKRAIKNLPDAQRAVIVLYYLENLDVSEVAYVLKIPEGTVKSRLYHARKKLERAIKERGYERLSEVVYDVT